MKKIYNCINKHNFLFCFNFVCRCIKFFFLFAKVSLIKFIVSIINPNLMQFNYWLITVGSVHSPLLFLLSYRLHEGHPRGGLSFQ